jgi:lauroyl/myristoyl acyltransferase
MATMTGATGRQLDELTVGVFGEFAMCFSDLITASRHPKRLGAYVGAIQGVGIDRLEGLDGPVISLTAHIGNWELAGRILAQHSARTTHVVVAVEEARALERWLRRDGSGIRFVPRSHPTVSLTLIAALRRGEAVALQGDRALGNRGDVPVPFFGHPAPFPIGAFQLARAAAVPIVPAFCTLDADGRYILKVFEPLKVVRGGEEDSLRAWVAMLEGLVAQKPTQWFNFFDIWSPFGA